ncbi:class I SAM-dependent methyltransferase [Flavobacteriaceae bacterium]|nr:class I SAM-dependent methyltransferase [Flavobacteriaceae bacterium]
MKYVDQTLTFESDKVYYVEQDTEFQVMMSWEDSIMKASADYICEGGGDILEIGFGMGISAGYIQANSITSHTIVENHPQMIEKAKAWAEDKPNVTIVEGDWYDVKDSLSTYDGIFYDTWADDNVDAFTNTLPSLAKPGARVTWWNNFTDTDDIFYMEGTTYQLLNVKPVDNIYFTNNIYHLPKMKFNA